MKSVEAQCQYEVTTFAEGPNCGVLGPASVHFFGLNEHGQACGRRSICGEVGQWLPIVWTEAHGLITLPLPEGATQGEANDINNVLGSDGFGQVACTLMFPALGGSRGYLYDDGEWTELPPAEGGPWSDTDSINDSTQIAGHRRVGAGIRAYLWEDGGFTDVHDPNSGGAWVFASNELGDIGGQMFFVDDHAFWWDGKSTHDLGTVFGGDLARVNGINATRDVTGGASLPPPKGKQFGPARAFLWEDGTVTDLGLLPNTIHAVAHDVNDAQQIIGFCQTSSFLRRPFLWQDGELMKLGDLIIGAPGFFGLAAVTAINNRGQIAGYTGGSAEGIILTPNVPLGDVTLDCEVDVDDLIAVLDDWGPCDDAGSIADIVTSQSFQPPSDGVVDGADLAVVLGNWTAPAPTRSVPRGR